MFLLKKGEEVGEYAINKSNKYDANVTPRTVSGGNDKPSRVVITEDSSSDKMMNITVNPALLKKDGNRGGNEGNEKKDDRKEGESIITSITSMLQGVEKPTDGKYRVMVCGTYPIGQSNGYSRVIYYICKYIGKKEDVKLTIYGFQNYNQTIGQQRKDVPESVTLHDALANEEPKRNGFGEKEIGGYLKKNPQDLVIIFNDPVITSSLVQNILETMTLEERRAFKLVSYMDQVYPYQRKAYIQLLNQYFDGIIAFTPYWRDTARELGIRDEIPIYFFPHGFDYESYYPIPSSIARVYHQLPSDAFLILNLNRNQPRKRWDHTIMALAEVIERHQKLKQTGKAKNVRPIKLVVGTQVQGFWDLAELLENELRRRKLPKELVSEYLHGIPNAQQLTDRDINVLYNACDIGINTCEGEGFGLCQFEHLALGCPQVAPNIGGFREFLNQGNSILVEPKWFYYVDKQRDGIGGLAEVGDTKDYADGIWRYYQNQNLVKKHGRKGREEILQHYRWESMVEVFYDVLKLLQEGPKIASS